MYQNRSPFGGTPPVVRTLIIINVVMLLITKFFALKGINLEGVLGLYYFQSEYFQPFQLITHMFMHGSWTHLLFNMFALWLFGRVLEEVWGPRRFLIYYFITGLGAAALHTFVNFIEISQMQHAAVAFANTPSPELYSSFLSKYLHDSWPYASQIADEWFSSPNNNLIAERAVDTVNKIVTLSMNIPTVGASGAVFGLLLAFGMLFPNTQLMLLIPPIPMKAKYVVIGYGLIELYLGIAQPGSNIAHFAHLGGMLFGFILIKYWNKTSKRFY
ncbi:MAG: rhomboid family intramembrane serine protease [Bacteroidota bacterium]|nr:rhomboid family intramembrane serine protease [Bacteroidota bacterium]